jgi:hypothetical protein
MGSTFIEKAKTPVRGSVNGGRIAKLTSPLGIKSQALRGLYLSCRCHDDRQLCLCSVESCCIRILLNGYEISLYYPGEYVKRNECHVSVAHDMSGSGSTRSVR